VPDDYFTVAELAAIPVRDFQAEERQRLGFERKRTMSGTVYQGLRVVD
jgi:hypothetical protein